MVGNRESLPDPSQPKLAPRSVLLGLIVAQSVLGLSYDIPGLFGPNPDYFGTLFDLAFGLYGGKLILGQLGVLKQEDTTATISALTGLECTVTLNIGREPGTWMAPEWAEMAPTRP